MAPAPVRARFRLSSAERFALAGAALLLLLHAFPLAPALEYRTGLLTAQPWRLITGHVVHINWPHVLVNTAAWVIVARLFAPDLSAPRQLLILGLSALAISIALAVLWPQIAWYRGFSGVLHGLFFAGAAAWLASAPRTVRQLWLPAALFLGGWIKIALEWPGAELPQAEWLGAAVVPQAHLIGAACGSLVGLGLAALEPRGPQQGKQQ